MLIGANLLFTTKKRGGIPSGWVEVEYIESTGTQYIDTGFLPGDNCGIRAKFMTMITNEDKIVVGCRSSVNQRWWINIGRYYIYYGWGIYKITTDLVKVGSVHECFLNYMNSQTYSTASGYEDSELFGKYEIAQSNRSAYMFAANDAGNAGLLCKARMYYCEFTRGDGIEMSFVPVRNATTNEGAMCDILTGEIYHNAGTGSFVIGPDVVPSRVGDYVQEGLVAMWDGIENAGFGLHDGAATVWKDLVGSVNLNLGSRVVGDDYIGVRQGAERNYTTFPNLITMYQSGEWTQEIVYRINRSVPSVTSGFFEVGGVGFFGKYSNADEKKLFIARVGGWQSYFNIDAIPKSGSITMQLTDEAAVRYLDGQFSQQNTAAKANHATGNSNALLAAMSEDFSVDIYCVRLYHKNLTPAEIAANYAVDKVRFGI